MRYKFLILSVSILLLNLLFVQSQTNLISSQPSTSVIPSGDSVLIEKDKEDSESQDEKDCYGKGCFDDDTCYPYGYTKEEKFCAVNYVLIDENGRVKYTAKSIFVEQVKTGKNCSNDFECLTNLCLGEICTNRTEEINRQVDVKLNEMKQEIVYKIDENIEKLNETENISVNTEHGEVVVDKSIIGKVLNWFKEIFS